MRPVAAVPAVEPEPSWSRMVMALVLLAVVIGVVLRFWTRSDLWLDEAQTVAIAGLPVSRMWHALSQDGSPPLYYLLLHFWMMGAGTSDLAVRSLSGLLGVASLPLAWIAARRAAGRWAGAGAVVLLACSPFAVRYSTEARMYMLIVFLTLVGYLLLLDALERPGRWRQVGLALVSGALLLSHYWCLYLIGSVVLGLGWQSRASHLDHAAARRCLVGVLGGFLLLAPWVPTLVFQLRHTGTPWATPAGLSAVVNTVSSFAGGGNSAGRALCLVLFVLFGVGVFGVATGARTIVLDLRTRPAARPAAYIFLATLVGGLIASEIVHSTFTSRYAAVVFAPFVIVAAMGVAALPTARLRCGALILVLLFGLADSVPNITVNRTQAGQVAAALSRRAHPGDTIVYCPDQLGPALSRLLPPHRYEQVTFPRSQAPQRVNWVDYAKVARHARPAAFARAAAAGAGAHDIWYVFSIDYLNFGSSCSTISATLGALRPGASVTVASRPGRYFEHENLYRYPPR